MRRLLWYLKLVQYIFLTKCPFQKGNCLDNANIFLSLERPLEIELYWWKWITFSLLTKLRLWLRQYPISRGTKKSLLSLWLFFRGLCSLQKDWQDAGRSQNGMQIPTKADWKQLELCNCDAPFVDPAILSIMQLLINFQTLS